MVEVLGSSFESVFIPMKTECQKLTYIFLQQFTEPDPIPTEANRAISITPPVRTIYYDSVSLFIDPCSIYLQQ